MKITRDEVQRVARLARLGLSPDEEEQLAGQLDRILGYMDKLNELDTSHVKPLARVVDIPYELRADEVSNEPRTEALLANAPAREDHFFKVPKIIE